MTGYGRTLQRVLLAAVAGFALSLASPGAAFAGKITASAVLVEADGDPTGSDWTPLGMFEFRSYGEHVHVADLKADGYSILVELWWGNKRKNGTRGPARLRGWCWDRNGANNGTVDCDYDIPDGAPITFFISEALRRTWKLCFPYRGCGKRTGYWVGPGKESQLPLGAGDFRAKA